MKKNEIRQHNNFTESVALRSALSKNIVYILLDKLTVSDASNKEYHITYDDLYKRTGVKATSGQIEKAVKVLQQPIMIKGLTHQDKDDFLSLSPFPRVEYTNGVLKIKINER